VPLVDIVVGKITIVVAWEILAVVVSFVEAIVKANK